MVTKRVLKAVVLYYYPFWVGRGKSELEELLLAEMKKHSLIECAVLNKEGQEIGRGELENDALFWYFCPSNFSLAHSFVLENQTSSGVRKAVYTPQRSQPYGAR